MFFLEIIDIVFTLSGRIGIASSGKCEKLTENKLRKVIFHAN